MGEGRFEVAVGDGVLVGHRRDGGPPALLLHGGPAFSDYTSGLADELDGIFSTIRYTQRGVPPSTVGPPYAIETHVADALAVLDHFGLDKSWAIGHSWGGHLALHLAVAHPERLLGIVCVHGLGPSGDILDEFRDTLRRGLSPKEIRFADEVEERRLAGKVTGEELLERMRLYWPNYFADRDKPAPMPDWVIGAACSGATWASIARHYEAGTLRDGLPQVRVPVLVVHGDCDPLPVRTAETTAELIPGAVLEVVPGRGHFPWLEQRGETRPIVERFLAGARR
jgi:proline iminopeptidase